MSIFLWGKKSASWLWFSIFYSCSHPTKSSIILCYGCSTVKLRCELTVCQRNRKILPPSNPGSIFFFAKKMAKDHVFSLIASLWLWRSLDHKVIVAHILFLCSRTWQGRQIKKVSFHLRLWVMYFPAELLQRIPCSDFDYNSITTS